MVSHTLRSRTVESSQRDDVATSQEGECDWPHDQPEGLDNELADETTQLSTAEASQAIDSEAQETETSKMTTGNIYSKESNVSDMSKLEFMITSLFTKLDENSKDLKNLQDKLDTNSKDLKNLQDKLDTNSIKSKRDFKALEDKVETTNKTLNKLENSHRELKESNDKFQKEVETRFEKLQESMKADLKTETENSIHKFNKENQKLNKQLTEKLDSEIRNVVHKVSEVQGEIEAELVAAKKSINTVQEEVERKLDQQAAQLDNKIDSYLKRIDNLDKEVVTIKEAIKENSDVILRRQGEHVEQMQLRVHQESSAETVDPLNEIPSNQASEVQTIESPNPENTDVILRRQREHVEQRLVGENQIVNCDPDDNEVGEGIPEYNNESSVPRSPCKEKQCTSNLCVFTSDNRSKSAIEMQASRNNISLSRVVESNKSNILQRALFLFVNNREVHPEYLCEFSQTRILLKNYVNGLGSYNSKHQIQNSWEMPL
jgi:chromosome segregation ATPase